MKNCDHIWEIALRNYPNLQMLKPKPIAQNFLEYLLDESSMCDLNLSHLLFRIIKFGHGDENVKLCARQADQLIPPQQSQHHMNSSPTDFAPIISTITIALSQFLRLQDTPDRTNATKQRPLYYDQQK